MWRIFMKNWRKKLSVKEEKIIFIVTVIDININRLIKILLLIWDHLKSREIIKIWFNKNLQIINEFNSKRILRINSRDTKKVEY